MLACAFVPLRSTSAQANIALKPVYTIYLVLLEFAFKIILNIRNAKTDDIVPIGTAGRHNAPVAEIVQLAGDKTINERFRPAC